MKKDSIDKLYEETMTYNRQDFLKLIIKLYDRIAKLENTIIVENARYAKELMKRDEKINLLKNDKWVGGY